jgi:hypothetical protein
VTPALLAGVDTVSYAFRSETTDAVDAFRRQPHRDGPGGSLVADERGPDGARILCWPANYLVAVETRLGALLAGTDRDHTLRPAADVGSGAVAARLVARDVLGLDLGESIEVRRFDLAAEHRFDTPAEGFAFLNGVAALTSARTVSDVWRAPDATPMTVYHRTPRRGVVKLRAYDKGLEAGTDPPGTRIRIESQNRPPKSKRYSPSVLSELDLQSTFGRTMTDYLATESIVSASHDGAVAHLVAAAARGDISTAKAERLAGSVAFLKYAGRAAYNDPDGSRRTNDQRSSRRLKELRRAGVVLDDLPAETVVPVSALLRDAVEAFGA